jgi:gamma-glutamyltranspeptidase/glutathione hydrolase
MRAAFIDFARVRNLDRLEFQPLEQEHVDARHADLWADAIKSGDSISQAAAIEHTQGTTHLHCVDEEGNVASHNHSIGCGGSGVVTPGLGFLYNNDANDGPTWESKRFIGGGSPLMLFDEDEPFMVIGAPGGSRISTSIIQGVLNVVDFDMDMQTALTAPRLHSEDRRHIYLEHTFKEDVARKLRDMGNNVIRNRYHARPQGILWRNDLASLEAGTDPRVGGAVGIFPPYDWTADFGGDFGPGKPPH